MTFLKKFLTMPLLTGFFLLTFNLNASATELNPEEIQHLTTLGFSEATVSSVSRDEYVMFYQDLEPLEETQLVTNYYKFIPDKYMPGNAAEVIKYTEAEALRELNNPRLIEPAAVGTNNSSWLAMTLSSTKLSNGRTLLKNEFMWKKNPQVFFKDVLAITHSASVIRYNDTINFRYIFKDLHGSDRYYTGVSEKNNYGVATRFNILGESGGKSHTGYLSFETNKANSGDIRANAYGHYTHTIVSISSSVSIDTGSISLGWGTKESKADDAAITFNW